MKKLLIGTIMLVLLAAGACTKPVDDSILNAPPGTVVDDTPVRADRRPPPARSGMGSDPDNPNGAPGTNFPSGSNPSR
ncbi:MAG: hypothetical protein ACHQK9_14390 [Reyranellales bacterium]